MCSPPRPGKWAPSPATAETLMATRRLERAHEGRGWRRGQLPSIHHGKILGGTSLPQAGGVPSPAVRALANWWPLPQPVWEPRMKPQVLCWGPLRETRHAHLAMGQRELSPACGTVAQTAPTHAWATWATWAPGSHPPVSAATWPKPGAVY